MAYKQGTHRESTPMVYSQGIPRQPRQGKSAPATPKADFKFGMIPDEVSRRNDLSQGGKVLFALILSFSRLKGGSCWLSNESLAERAGLCVKQVKRLLARLEGLGLIARRIEHQRRAGIFVTWSPTEQVSGDIVSLGVGTSCPVGGPEVGTSWAREESGREKIKIRIHAPLPDEDEDEDEDAPLSGAEVAREIRAMIGRRPAPPA